MYSIYIVNNVSLSLGECKMFHIDMIKLYKRNYVFYVDFSAYLILDTAHGNKVMPMTYSSTAYLQLICDHISHECYKLYFPTGFSCVFLLPEIVWNLAKITQPLLHFEDFRGI